MTQTHRRPSRSRKRHVLYPTFTRQSISKMLRGQHLKMKLRGHSGTAASRWDRDLARPGTIYTVSAAISCKPTSAPFLSKVASRRRGRRSTREPLARNRMFGQSWPVDTPTRTTSRTCYAFSPSPRIPGRYIDARHASSFSPRTPGRCIDWPKLPKHPASSQWLPRQAPTASPAGDFRQDSAASGFGSSYVSFSDMSLSFGVSLRPTNGSRRLRVVSLLFTIVTSYILFFHGNSHSFFSFSCKAICSSGVP